MTAHSRRKGVRGEAEVGPSAVTVRECERCGTTFPVTTYNRRYCSHNCKRLAYEVRRRRRDREWAAKRVRNHALWRIMDRARSA